MTNYKFWQEALKDPLKIGKDLPVHENDPQLGFYRMRDKDGGDMVPVAIWHDGELIAKAGDKMVIPTDVWSFCCRYPVSHEDYTDFVNGKGWKDTPPDVSAINKKEVEKVESATASIGHNQPASDYERLTEEFYSEKELAEEFLKKPISTQEEADKIANWTKRIAGYSTEAEALHKVEKAPHLKASREVDDKWRELKEDPKTLASRMKRHLQPWLEKLAKEEEERQRLAREKVEQARREAEAAARKAEDVHPNPNDPEAEAAARKAEDAEANLRRAENEAKAQKTNAGRTGSKVTLREYTFGLIKDFDKALFALKDHPEIKELVQVLADRSARAGVKVEGIEIKKEKRAV